MICNSSKRLYMDMVCRWVKGLGLKRCHCDTDSLGLQVSVTTAASKWQLWAPKLAKAEPWCAQRKAQYAEDIALVLKRMDFGHCASFATSQPVATFSRSDCWLFGILIRLDDILCARKKFSFHKMSSERFDCFWFGFVACQCPLSLAGSTQTGPFDRGKRNQAYRDHCFLA